MTKAPNRHPLKWWWGDACLLINLPNNCTTLPNSWNIAVSSVKCFGAFGALPHWGCGWVYYACIHVLVLISYCVEFLWSWAELFLCENEICFKIWVLGILTPRAGRPPEYFDLRHHIKLSSSSYNGWSVRIASAKIFPILEACPFKLRVDLTPNNLPLALACYHAKFSWSTAMLPLLNRWLEIFHIGEPFSRRVWAKN